MMFTDDMAKRLATRVQLTTDGHRAYLDGVEGAFGCDVEYAQLVKIFGAAPGPAGRYSPAERTGAKKVPVEGKPDLAHVSTSYVERQNLTMRVHMRRFTRLTNAFSKGFENHAHMVALHALWYNFARVHKSLRVSPAMAAGISDQLWSMEDVAALVEAADVKPTAKRGPCGLEKWLDPMKNGRKKTKIEHYAWLVENRSENQQSTLKIYKIIKDYEKKLKRDRRARLVANLLTGAAFSLWRAVFLSELDQERGALMQDAEKFLVELIENNAISYVQDKKSKEWTFRYYVQSARDRLKTANKILKANAHGFGLKGESVGLSPADWWELHQEALNVAVASFEKALRAPGRLQKKNPK